ncbi:MAG: hydantoinase/oxoprolinase family protein [Acidimicrobiia bacterium]
MNSKNVVGVDVGGTFTDFAHWDGTSLRTSKVGTTVDQSQGIAAGLATAQVQPQLLLHGTTVATNALLQRKGGRTLLVTDRGFEDLIEIGRQVRPSLYDSDADRSAALILRDNRIGWDSEEALLRQIDAAAPEAVAVAMLNSFVDPGSEQDISQAIASRFPTLPVSVSHEVNPEFREYERVATTVLNAYLQPVVARYLSALEERLDAERVLVMRSSGGLTSIFGATALAASILLSGPAGGVVAAARCGGAHGWKRVISFDMGGTSTDVSRIENGEPQMAGERILDGLVCRMPSVAIHTIGAGGGSIGWADQGGTLRVGPHSAGAVPGPASYGRGGREPTVTDANLLVGRLGSDMELAARTVLRFDFARAALAVLGEKLGLDPMAAATGILEIINTHMEGAVRRVTIEEGADPRSAALLAFGGAGGLYATRVARGLGMPAVLVPPHAGVFSALGLLLSPQRQDVVRTVRLRPDLSDLDHNLAQLEEQAGRGMRASLGASPSSLMASVDARYRGQSHETNVAYERGAGAERLRADFATAHRVRNGFVLEEHEVEVVTLRVAATAPSALTWDDLTFRPEPGEPRLGERTAADGSEIARWWRPAIAEGSAIEGPALIEEAEATTFVDRGERARVLGDGTLELTW